jgi:murein DD-endopeptidase MepM/ murein hydrolase activator NlpD
MPIPGLPAPVESLNPGAAPDPGASGSAERRRLEQVAQEFEAMLLLQMVRQMRHSLLSTEADDEGLGASTMMDTLDVELARQLSAQGGIGLATVIARSLSRVATAPTPVPEAARVAAAAAPVATPTPSRSRAPAMAAVESTVAERNPGAPSLAAGELTLPLDAGVASGFGWRMDPFHGRQRFHTGVDLKAAYGREVPVAAPGRVVFAGERGTYGSLVIVEHADGLETRYAHLSAITVQPGQQLASGDLVGRVGRSGRATGPHLHFEVLVNGARVDPTRLARALAEPALPVARAGD